MKTFLAILVSAIQLLAEANAWAAPAITLLQGPNTAPMQEAMRRLGFDFEAVESLPAAIPPHTRLMVICGTQPPVPREGADTLRKYLERGDAVLVVGGGARWAIDHRLLDASGYYPNGTTIHQTSFEGIHPAIAGYPGTKPKENWDKGVPMLFRLTGGPLMELGPAAVSILSYGPPFSAAAMQPHGRGLLFAISPDPQGGDVYYTLEKATPTTGAEQNTDRFLANVISFLLDRTQNLLPNPRFDNPLRSPKEFSGWNISTKRGATGSRTELGIVRLTGEGENGGASFSVSNPILVEPGQLYQFRVRHRGTARWSYRFSSKPRPKGMEGAHVQPTVYVTPAGNNWSDHVETISIRPNHSYLSLTLNVLGEGTLELDEVFLGKTSGHKPTGN